MFTPDLDFLAPQQRRLWRVLSEVPDDFVLYGGTALTLRLGHRPSVDFDFFANRRFEPGALEREISWLQEAVRQQSAPNSLVVLVDRGGPVNVSFFGGLSRRRVHDPETAKGTGVLVASMLDLAATKLMSVQDRAEAKDYLDIASAIASGIDLAEATAAARAIYGKTFNPVLSLKALCYFEDGDLPSLPAAVRVKIVEAVKVVDVTALPVVEPLRGGLVPDRR